MQYSSRLLVKTYIFILTATWGLGWQFFTSLSDLTLINSPKDRLTPDSNDLKKVAGTDWMLKAEDWVLWRSLGEAYVNQWTAIVEFYWTPDSTTYLEHVHSEYYFGHCKDPTRIFYNHVHLDNISVMGKVIVRGWIDVIRIPTCIVLRGMAFDVDLVRSTTYPFQMCVPRVAYCHTHHIYKYFYYELYVPDDMIGGMDWEIYFFGPPTTKWG